MLNNFLKYDIKKNIDIWRKSMYATRKLLLVF